METLTPLFNAMTSGVHRLEQQEEQENADAEKERQAEAERTGRAPAPKKRKTMEEITRRGRRLVIRLASMANRCFWLSAAEISVHILTDGDCIQSHNNITVFTKQLQWAVQQCKKQLNHETVEAPAEKLFQNVETIGIHVQSERRSSACGTDENGEHDDTMEPDSDVDIVKIEACNTKASDDYAHRGKQLSSMPFYIYRMYVCRIAKPGKAKLTSPTIFCFEPHYALAKSYAQEVVLHNIHVPTIDGFQCPTVEQDPEQNALLKAILFTPWSCTDPMTCGSVLNYKGLLSNNNHPDMTAAASSERPASSSWRRGACQPATSSSGSGAASQLPTTSPSARKPRQCIHEIRRAWVLRRSEIIVLAGRADCRCSAARKKLVLADTTTFAEVKETPPDDNTDDNRSLHTGEEVKEVLMALCRTRLFRSPPTHAIRLILAFLGMPCRWHPERVRWPNSALTLPWTLWRTSTWPPTLVSTRIPSRSTTRSQRTYLTTMASTSTQRRLSSWSTWAAETTTRTSRTWRTFLSVRSPASH